MENSVFESVKWHNLIDKTYSEIQEIIETQVKNQEKQEKTFKNNEEVLLYESFPSLGLSLCFKEKKLFSVYLYSFYDKKFKKFCGVLPYNLSFGLNNQEIVSKFGEPNQKFGGKTIPIGISYDNLGLEIDFVSNSWEDYQNPISFLCIFKPENNPNKSICGLCAKKAEYFCGKCRLVKYCSQNCQKVHWKVHKKFCE